MNILYRHIINNLKIMTDSDFCCIPFLARLLQRKSRATVIARLLCHHAKTLM